MDQSWGGGHFGNSFTRHLEVNAVRNSYLALGRVRTCHEAEKEKEMVAAVVVITRPLAPMQKKVANPCCSGIIHDDDLYPASPLSWNKETAQYFAVHWAER